jgi:hypothetical protein
MMNTIHVKYNGEVYRLEIQSTIAHFLGYKKLYPEMEVTIYKLLCPVGSRAKTVKLKDIEVAVD